MNTKPGGHLHKQAVEAQMVVWKRLAAIVPHSNLSQVPWNVAQERKRAGLKIRVRLLKRPS